jgi:peptidoglycan/xylan/chitin deacetylase (PgdA/CDA1 family)
MATWPPSTHQDVQDEVQAHRDTLNTGRLSDATLKGSYASLSTLPLPGPGTRYRNITIVVYHVVSLTPFQTDCNYYQQWNYTTVTCDDVLNHINGTATLPAKPLLITFDDGYASQYAAAQELNTRGMKGVWYLTTNWIDGTETQAQGGFLESTPLTWAQVTQMRAWGHDIQSHTASHPNLTTVTGAQAASEFTTSKARLEAQLPGLTVRHMAYPNGAWNATVRAALVGAGCLTARVVRIDSQYPTQGAGAGRYVIATTYHDPMALPAAGTGWADVAQPNYNRTIAPMEELIPDFGFEAGGKGWSLGGGFAVNGTDFHDGSKSLVCTQGTSTVSSITTLGIPMGLFARLHGEVWIKTSGLPAGTLVKVQHQLWRPDYYTQYGTFDLVTVTGNNNAWTLYTWEYNGDENAAFTYPILWVQGNAAPSGTARFDGMTLQRELPPVPFGLPF